jgi:hypothetical protein
MILDYYGPTGYQKLAKSTLFFETVFHTFKKDKDGGRALCCLILEKTTVPLSIEVMKIMIPKGYRKWRTQTVKVSESDSGSRLLLSHQMQFPFSSFAAYYTRFCADHEHVNSVQEWIEVAIIDEQERREGRPATLTEAEDLEEADQEDAQKVAREEIKLRNKQEADQWERYIQGKRNPHYCYDDEEPLYSDAELDPKEKRLFIFSELYRTRYLGRSTSFYRHLLSSKCCDETIRKVLEQEITVKP